MLTPRIMRREDLFDNFFNDFSVPSFRFTAPELPAMMKTDVKETNEGYELTVDLPGFTKEAIQIQLKDGTLTINASRNKDTDEKDENGKFVRRERFYGNCARSFYVGEHLENEDVKAKFENGILTLFVPKKAPQPKIEENKYIAIEG